MQILCSGSVPDFTGRHGSNYALLRVDNSFFSSCLNPNNNNILTVIVVVSFLEKSFLNLNPSSNFLNLISYLF